MAAKGSGHNSHKRHHNVGKAVSEEEEACAVHTSLEHADEVRACVIQRAESLQTVVVAGKMQMATVQMHEGKEQLRDMGEEDNHPFLAE